MTIHNRPFAACLGGALAITASQAGAAGFMLYEQGVSGLGNAFAGAASSAQDASTIYFNPAGMSRLGNSELVGAAHFISPSTEFKNLGSRTAAAFGGAPLTGGDGGDGGVDALVPNLYYSRAVNDRWTAGLGISVPFGLATDWENDWIGRYHALGSELKTVNLNPAVAFQASPRWSLGFGVSALYGDLTEFSNAIDTFGVCLGALASQGVVGAPAVGTCNGVGLPGPANAATDARVRLEGDDWGYGFNVGVLFQPDSRTRIGLAYRSKVELEFEGSARYNLSRVPAAFLQNVVGGAPIFKNTGAKAELVLPEMVAISSHQELSDEWTLMGDITWTRWSRFDELVVEFANGARDLVINEDWDDSWRFSLGATYTYSPAWRWRFGVAYDQAAATRNDRVSPRIPDEDRTWLTTGFSWAAMDNLDVDVSYAHLFLPDRKVRVADASTGHVLVGEFESAVDILSAQVRWRFQ